MTNRNPDNIDFLMIAGVRESGNETLKYMKSKVHLRVDFSSFLVITYCSSRKNHDIFLKIPEDIHILL